MAIEVLKGVVSSGKTFTYTNTSGWTRQVFYILTNKEAAGCNLNISIGTVLVAPKNLLLDANESLREEDLILLDGDNLTIKSTGSIDYYIVLKNATNN